MLNVYLLLYKEEFNRKKIFLEYKAQSLYEYIYTLTILDMQDMLLVSEKIKKHFTGEWTNTLCENRQDCKWIIHRRVYIYKKYNVNKIVKMKTKMSENVIFSYNEKYNYTRHTGFYYLCIICAL